ncbi:hypothetical protein G3I59_37225 [Amycolatopsis rubida]|uniref:Uncharacterized protein n=1 Tax=Amycolatopsis rubida TaxID=112413 RepID=A0ABX0C3F5_9PSEU|nr:MULTISPECIES: hypothetical protein [Amycolatopsis]MYW96101.1 hypothetical protein [Amycolatopsis rubida]NEC61092.1 hypothetical protein [Amycolatopsis rubida]OAP23388.1 hypothetical protein A4R44_06035 [Amycolatopsis sp. M39]
MNRRTRGEETDRIVQQPASAAVRSPVRGFVDGRLIDSDLDRLELESARRALRLLHERIPPTEMAVLLAPDIERSDAQWREWAVASAGTWQPCFVDLEATEITKTEFLAWWSDALDDLHGIMYPAFPEHYLFDWAETAAGERRLMVVEELGHVPFRMYCEYGPEWAPAAPLPGYEPVSVGVGRLADGTDTVRFMSQIRQDSGLLRLHAGMYVGSAVPARVVEAHQDQLLVEWTRWIEMAVGHAAAARTA